jgi:lysophospholipase L1-like esterase
MSMVDHDRPRRAAWKSARTGLMVLAGFVLIGVIGPVAAVQAQAPRPDDPAKAKPAAKTEAPKVDLRGLFQMHYDFRVRSFAEQNQPYRNVVLLGDSITEGFEVPKYFPGRRVLNRGIGGDVIGNDLPDNDKRGVLRRLDNSLFDCAATDVFLLIGVNDLNSGRNVDQMEKGYRELLRRIKERAPAVKIHVQSLLPTRGNFDHLNPPIRDFNGRLKRMAAEFGNDFIDLHALFLDKDGKLKADSTPDGLHLNDAAYRVWRKRILEILSWDDSAK